MAALRLISSCFALAAVGVGGAGKKPLFEYDDHYVMLNDHGRNEFYRRALSRVVPKCGPSCSVLDVGAGSGLLSIFSANLGAEQVFAIEANPDLAKLAVETISRNQKFFPKSNVTVVAELSSRVPVESMPGSRPADILVTETFGTMLLGEGAINFVPNARDRLLKPGGIVVPAGGCQYATLVEVPELAAMAFPENWGGFNLSRWGELQDTVYWKSTMGNSRVPINRISDRVCVLEIDLYRDNYTVVPDNATFKLKATRDGTVHAILYDWDVWAEPDRQDLLSNAPGQTRSSARGFAGDVAWGWLLQFVEEVGADWQYAAQQAPPFKVKKGDALDLGVEFIARGISLHSRVRRSLPPGAQEELRAPVGAPARLRGINRQELVEASEYYLPVVGDADRHSFYQKALAAAVERRRVAGAPVETLLDCSSGAGVPALSAATQHGMKVLALPARGEYAKVMRRIVQDANASHLVEVYAASPRDLIQSLLPDGELVDVAVVDPPGTPMAGVSPWAMFLSLRRLLKEGGTVIPAGGCFQVGLVESLELAELTSVPNGMWQGPAPRGPGSEVVLTNWNEEARRQGVVRRITPYTKWLGPKSTLKYRWLSEPKCVFEADFAAYSSKTAKPEEAEPEKNSHFGIEINHDGVAHAIVGQWTVWASQEDKAPRLGPDGGPELYHGRGLTWPRYVQQLARPGTGEGFVEPVEVRAGEVRSLSVTVRQGKSKKTGVAGPEFVMELDEAEKPEPLKADGEL